MYRYTILLVAIILLQSTIHAQPALIKISGHAPIPHLSTTELLELDELHKFKHKEGVIIYHDDEDSWQLYQYLQGFEEFGKIINIIRAENVILITLEQKGIIISDRHAVQADFSFVEASLYNGKVYALGINRSIAPDRSLSYCESQTTSTTISDIMIFDPEKYTIDYKRLEQTISGISSCTFFEGSFWLSVLCDGVEMWHHAFYKISEQGTITDYSLDNPFGVINRVYTNKDSLYLLSHDHFYKITSQDTTHHVLPFQDIYRHSVTIDNSIAYYLDKFPGNSRKFRIFRYNLDKNTLDTITIRNNLVGRNYDYLAFEGSLYALPENLNKIDRVDLHNNNFISHYIFKKGIESHIDNMVEDEDEIWYISMELGLVRYSKIDSTWMNIPINLDLLSDSSCTLYFDQLTINEDYVFVPLKDERSMHPGYVLYHRETATMEQLTSEAFREMFFSYEGRFASYKNEAFAREQYSDTLKSFFDFLPEFHALLFLYDLPTSGSDVWNFRYKKVDEHDYSIFSTCILDYPPTWFIGAVIKYDDQRIKVVEFPYPISYIDHPVVPYLISGDEFVIYGSSQGNGSKGFFIYHVLSEKIESEALWHETVGDIHFIRDVGSFVIIATYDDELFSFNKITRELIDFSEHISGFPRYLESSGTYVYIGTDKELVYFDMDMNFLGKLFDQRSLLHHTDYGLYLNTGNEIYRIVEE